MSDAAWEHHEQIERIRDAADEAADSAHSDRTANVNAEIDTALSIIYVWQMLAGENWNIIGLMTPQGQALPMVTTSFDVAWQAFEIAQEHANRHQTRCRLAAFKFDNLMAVVEPEPERASDG